MNQEINMHRFGSKQSNRIVNLFYLMVDYQVDERIAHAQNS